MPYLSSTLSSKSKHDKSPRGHAAMLSGAVAASAPLGAYLSGTVWFAVVLAFSVLLVYGGVLWLSRFHPP